MPEASVPHIGTAPSGRTSAVRDNAVLVLTPGVVGGGFVDLRQVADHG
ncbi:hypothetical protein ACQP1G_32545 [Nocardia sp. CA-107356]